MIGMMGGASWDQNRDGIGQSGFHRSNADTAWTIGALYFVLQEDCVLIQA